MPENNILQIYSVNGPVIKVSGKTNLRIHEIVHVGKNSLIGEVISVSEEETVIQVYEETSGLHPGEEITPTGSPLEIELGPGLLGKIFDGIGRPLQKIEEKAGSFISAGYNPDTIDKETERITKITVKPGDILSPGDVYATVKETDSVTLSLTVPPDVSGEVTFAEEDGEYTADRILIKIGDKELSSITKWPVRTPRPVKSRADSVIPLITGQRVIDTLFPIAKGGSAAIPGGFGTGKTMLQHQFAKWSDADIIVYVGCGERGNEMTQVLDEFSSLTDPRTGRMMLERTVLIGNTSNMPVAAREASIYTGVTIAEYFRDMGFHVALMADSTSRWAEALREISGRLEEMPAEEGFPSYLPSRLAAFYERAGYVTTLSGREGSVSIIGAVSPQGSDFSEPVTQNTKRFIRCFWGLDKSLAYSRHYPAVNWNISYSEYCSELDKYYNDNIGNDFSNKRDKIKALLNEEDKLMEVVKLVGSDLLAEPQKLILETAKTIRLGFLQQNAMNDIDCYVPLSKQYKMMSLILHIHEKASESVSAGIPVSYIRGKGIFEIPIKVKYEIPNDQLEKFDSLTDEIDNSFRDISDYYSKK